MNYARFPRFILFILFVFAVLVPLGFIVMALWNNILAAVVPVAIINFWQALGLFLLAKIFFGGFPGRPGWARHGRGRQDMKDMRQKWFNMSPDERAEFKQKLKGRCGTRNAAATPTEPTAE